MAEESTGHCGDKSRSTDLLSSGDSTSLNEIMGWGFLGFGIASTFGIGIDEADLTNGILWCLLAKACWIHADIKGR